MFESTSIKAYVHVSVDFDDTGRMRPTSILWEDGTHYEIDRVLDVRPAFAARAGGQGDRYTIRLGEQITYLFFEHNVDYGATSLAGGLWSGRLDTTKKGGISRPVYTGLKFMLVCAALSTSTAS